MPLFSRSRALEPAGLIFLSLLLAGVSAPAQSSWYVARDGHFEVYSEAGAEDARAALARFEQLRVFFLQQGFSETPNPPKRLRVIGFRSEQSYEAYRLRPAADAFYAALGEQQFIVLPGLEPSRYRIGAHEYAHVMLNGSGVRLPLWLNEGLAEYFSTVTMGDHGTEIGGDLPARSQTLARNKWIPLPQIFYADAAWLAKQSEKQNAMFYAESWALTNVLLSHVSNSVRFGDLVRTINDVATSADIVARIYSPPLAALEEEARMKHPAARNLSAIPKTVGQSQTASASDYEIGVLLADLLAADGELKLAAAHYRHLLQLKPDDANVHAALGNLALRDGDKPEAVREWKTAIDKGVQDADVCFEYAQLANEQGSSNEEIRPALERAIALRPDLDDARYSLALLESNAGEFEAALSQFHAMHEPSRARVFAYWTAVAYAATELDRREEAAQAAQRALDHAATPDERARALEAAYLAKTDLTVQVTHTENGETRLITTRVPHGTKNFNPFIEPEDQIRRVAAKLSEVQCDGGRLARFVLQTDQGPLSLAVPNPARVLLRNSTGEFTCGAQSGQRVEVEYATQGNILRGMTFH